MIALCGEHHDKADAGAFTKEQLRGFKQRGADQVGNVTGRFDWMRNDLLAVVGGNFFHETPVIFRFHGQPVIFFNRDEDGYLLLNVAMLTTSSEPRAVIQDNYWLNWGSPDDLDCPPSGKLLHVKYSNGDMVRIEFRELMAMETAAARYPDARPDGWGIDFPITAVEVHMRVGGTNINFGPRETSFGGIIMSNNFMSKCGAGIAID
jgi:hypothetical protein